MPEKKGGLEIAMHYKIRSRLLRKSAKFLMGQELREISCMELVRDLIVGERARITRTSTSNTVLTSSRVICKPTCWL